MSTLMATPDSRHLRATAARIAVTLTDDQGEPADPGDVTVGIVNAAGDTVLAAGTATDAGVTGERYVTLTAADTVDVDQFTATWTDEDDVVRAVTYHDIVGGYWFGLSELAALPGVSEAVTKVPDVSSTVVLARLRREVEERFEMAMGVAWVRRYTREAHDGGCEIILDWTEPRVLRSLTIDGVAQTVGDYVLERIGVLRRKYGGPIPAGQAQGVVPGYEHGFSRPDEPLKQAALRYASLLLFDGWTSFTSARTISQSVDGVLTSFARIDADHPTGIPDIDAVLTAPGHMRRTPGVA